MIIILNIYVVDYLKVCVYIYVCVGVLVGDETRKGIMREEKELFREEGKRGNELCIKEKQKGRVWGRKGTSLVGGMKWNCIREGAAGNKADDTAV